MSAQTKAGRRVVAQISMSLDGRVTGPEGPSDMEIIAGYAGSDAAHARSAEALAAATTALLGRVNYEGFYGYWPPVAADETADPRDRNIARWLDDVEKVVFSTTMTDATWANSRIAERGPVEEVQQLRGTDGGDILVVNSVSIIRQLLAGEQVDRLLIDLVPEVAGGGATLFEDGLPPSSWSLTDAVTAADGALLLTYDR
ncbi:MAG TPA: dihydrofolate reductase family protein [Gaiellaceae bacterium]|nr:dihydrofolate reductase family protein [Gaiellaceae bacterium]